MPTVGNHTASAAASESASAPTSASCEVKDRPCQDPHGDNCPRAGRAIQIRSRHGETTVPSPLVAHVFERMDWVHVSRSSFIQRDPAEIISRHAQLMAIFVGAFMACDWTDPMHPDQTGQGRVRQLSDLEAWLGHFGRQRIATPSLIWGPAH